MPPWVQRCRQGDGHGRSQVLHHLWGASSVPNKRYPAAKTESIQIPREVIFLLHFRLFFSTSQSVMVCNCVHCLLGCWSQTGWYYAFSCPVLPLIHFYLINLTDYNSIVNMPYFGAVVDRFRWHQVERRTVSSCTWSPWLGSLETNCVHQYRLTNLCNYPILAMCMILFTLVWLFVDFLNF